MTNLTLLSLTGNYLAELPATVTPLTQNPPLSGLQICCDPLILGGNVTMYFNVISVSCLERDVFIDSLLVRIYFIIVMIRWTGLAP